jgi:hypothetical protein
VVPLRGATFLFCSAWTLIANEHIRIDIVNSLFSKRVRNWIDMIGHVFALVPFCLVMIWTSIPFFLASYRLGERSFSAGGLPQWPAKLLIPLAFTVLLVQAVSEIIKRAAIMRGIFPIRMMVRRATLRRPRPHVCLRQQNRSPEASERPEQTDDRFHHSQHGSDYVREPRGISADRISGGVHARCGRPRLRHRRHRTRPVSARTSCKRCPSVSTAP